MTEEPAIFFLANDRVLENTLRLLASIKFYRFPNKIYYVPFDDNVDFTARVFAAYGGECYDANLKEIDAISRRI